MAPLRRCGRRPQGERMTGASDFILVPYGDRFLALTVEEAQVALDRGLVLDRRHRYPTGRAVRQSVPWAHGPGGPGGAGACRALDGTATPLRVLDESQARRLLGEWLAKGGKCPALTLPSAAEACRKVLALARDGRHYAIYVDATTAGTRELAAMEGWEA
jgi:hypothetical protein